MSSPSLVSTRRIDAICGRFEAAWKSGEYPAIEAILADAEPEERSQLLGELVAMEFELRLTEGQACREQNWPAVDDLLEAAQDEPLSADAVNIVASLRRPWRSGR